LIIFEDEREFQYFASMTNLFSMLDENLSPTVWLIGIKNDKGKDRTVIFPKGTDYKLSRFKDIRAKTKHLQDKSNSSPKRAKILCLRDALEMEIRKDDTQRSLISFCSLPVLVNEYHVSVVLQLQRDIFFSHDHLDIDKNITSRLATSLIDATVLECLEIYTKELSKPVPRKGFMFAERPPDEIMRAAGRRLMYTPIARLDADIAWHYQLYSLCNAISAMKYEGASGDGGILVAVEDHPDVKVDIHLSNPIPIYNYRSDGDYRSVRKLLEMCSDKLRLLCNGNHIYGLGREKRTYDPRDESLFLVRFLAPFSWELLHDEHRLMQVVHDLPKLPETRIEKSEFVEKLCKVFPNLGTTHSDRLWALVEAAIEQKHGTMVVILDDAKDEAERLKNQATIVKPFPLTGAVMKDVTAIDGAVLIDMKATCYAIGAILDGVASDKGTPARGARYNSAIRYVDEKPKCIAIVISEDGMVNLIHKDTEYDTA